MHIRIISSILFLNALLLAYLIWEKSTGSGCASCHQVFFWPIADVFIAKLGFVASIAIAILTYFSDRFEFFKYCGLFISLITSGCSVFLSLGQLYWAINICYQCIFASTVFYVVFCYLLYIVVIRHRYGAKLKDEL